MAATDFPTNPADIDGGRYTKTWHGMCARLGTSEARAQNIGGVCEVIGSSLRTIIDGWRAEVYKSDHPWKIQSEYSSWLVEYSNRISACRPAFCETYLALDL